MTVFDDMAASAAEDITCMLCSYVMIDPVQLPYCSHAMCRACVQRISRQNVFICPMRCRPPAGYDSGVQLTDAAVQSLPTHVQVADRIQWHAALVFASGFDASALKTLSSEVTTAFVEAGLQHNLATLRKIVDDDSMRMGAAAVPVRAPTSPSAMYFSIQNVCFPSLRSSGLQFQSFGASERLRVSVRRHSKNEPPAFAIWAERKSSKEQWELDVDDVAEHCDIAVPAKVVLSRLKVSSAHVGASAAAL
jgi:hypothetical protein